MQNVRHRNCFAPASNIVSKQWRNTHRNTGLRAFSSVTNLLLDNYIYIYVFLYSLNLLPCAHHSTSKAHKRNTTQAIYASSLRAVRYCSASSLPFNWVVVNYIILRATQPIETTRCDARALRPCEQQPTNHLYCTGGTIRVRTTCIV